LVLFLFSKQSEECDAVRFIVYSAVVISVGLSIYRIRIHRAEMVGCSGAFAFIIWRLVEGLLPHQSGFFVFGNITGFDYDAA
jgi:hypothetical protein